MIINEFIVKEKILASIEAIIKDSIEKHQLEHYFYSEGELESILNVFSEDLNKILK